MTRSLLLLFIVAIACAGPASSPNGGGSSARADSRPSWVGNPYRHPRVNRATHMADEGSSTGTSGAAREAAILHALSGISGTIMSEITTELEVVTKQRRQDDDVTWTEDLKKSIRTRSQDTLPGHDMVDSWIDTENGETVVLVVVSRKLLCSTLFPGVERAITEAGEYLTTPAAPMPTQALKDALLAYGVLGGDRMVDAIKSRVVAEHSVEKQRAERNFARATEMLDEASKRVARLARTIRIDKLSGDGQTGDVRGSLAEPLSARLSVVDESGSTHALARFPARFVTAQDPGPALAHPSASTDDNGLISCKVSDLVPTGKASNEIVIEAGFGELAPSYDRSRIPSEHFTYLLPTPGQTSVLVLISDDFEGDPLDRQITGDHLADHLSKRGFDVKVVDPTSREGRILAAIDDTALAKRVEDLHPGAFDYVIHGHTKTRFSSRSCRLTTCAPEPASPSPRTR